MLESQLQLLKLNSINRLRHLCLLLAVYHSTAYCTLDCEVNCKMFTIFAVEVLMGFSSSSKCGRVAVAQVRERIKSLVTLVGITVEPPLQL